MSPWLSVWGLVADMAGVAIITYDIWPEYRVHRLREAIEWQYKVLISSLSETQEDEEPAQTIQEMLHSMGRSEMDRLRQRLGLPAIGEGRMLPTEEEIARSRIETDAAIARKMAKIETRTRPPVGFGVMLVILGFLLQLLGALPPAFVRAHFGG
ncbi:hypothetical protein [Methylobacterium sp. J-076]|uniref:hypothetical protein n=1 Tax=Methylobacterium sp. J-076 TaxID=2836655 RepID=UPI001FBAC4B0|nr:hypothetical protein [Methylobacterium sp. J-076]MCJ2012170.1 hypothetical protein [Methylobacterium sp. J-076]